MRSQDLPAWKRHETLFRGALPQPERHEIDAPALAEWIGDALAQRELFPPEDILQKRVPQVVLFTYLCAPRVASRQGLIAAAEFLFIFFLFNDDWEAMGQLLDEHGARSTDRRVSFVREWLERLEQQHGGRASRFLASFRSYQASLGVEHAYGQQPGHPTLDEYLDKLTGRYQWIATSPYIDLWELVEGIDVSDEQRPLTEPLKELAVELVYIANDVGSIARDPHQKNYVRFLLAELGTSATLEQALEETVRVYKRKAHAFVEKASELSSALSMSPYVDMVAHVTDGNVLATIALAEQGRSGRYSPAVRTCLASLPLLTSLVPGRVERRIT
jgi:hypothetical protein